MSMSSVCRWIAFCTVFAGSTVALADWPQYRGANGDGIYAEKALASWPASGPKVLWKKPSGEGIGSIAIQGEKAFYTAADGAAEACVALDLKTGKPLWSKLLDQEKADRSGDQGGPGPCSTPAVSGDKVYAYSSHLILVCFSIADGKEVWKHDVAAEFAGQTNTGAVQKWGSATSPIVEGDLVIVSGGGAGQTFLAFNKETGAVVWKKHDEKMTHSTPVPAEIGGVRQVIFLMQSGLVSLDPKTGEILWKAPYKYNVATGASPVVVGDIVFCTAGYNVGGGAFQVTAVGGKFSAKELWQTPNKAMGQWTTPIVKDGFLYLINGSGAVDNAKLQCVDLKTGQLKWDGPAVGQGQLLLVDGKLIVQTSKGKLLLADPNPQAYKELASAQPISGQAWGLPSISEGILVYRTNKEIAAVDLSTK
jgi:outer membrane protein assembly factor BamB